MGGGVWVSLISFLRFATFLHVLSVPSVVLNIYMDYFI